MEIIPFKQDYLPQMAALFIQNFKRLRQTLPVLPDHMQDSIHVSDMLGKLFDQCPGVIALNDGNMVGYMGWYIVDHFRHTDRAAYCPEWGHAAAVGLKAEVYRSIYRDAARQWLSAGCQIHALTLLANDKQAENVWFWNGFGLIVVDAIRSTKPLGITTSTSVTIRKATLDDVDALAALDIEHHRHYTEAPVLMRVYEAQTSADLTRFLNATNNSIWLAMDGDKYLGFMRFDTDNDDSVAIVKSPDQVSITGAYVRPEYRGYKIAVTLLDAAIQHYAALGYKRCSVSFESFNPEAAVFWPKYFEPVCLSLMRIPEIRPSSP